MTNNEIIEFLQQIYKTDNVRYIGSGTDSVAFILDNEYIIRFIKSGNNIYNQEKKICDYIKKHISFDVPQIEIITQQKETYAKHKMIKGNKWSWHSFVWKRRKQINLAKSLAKFMAELHSINIIELQKHIPDIQNIPYVSMNTISEYIKPYITNYQLKYLQKRYSQIKLDNPKPNDLVLCHLGIKGPNSVVNNEGFLTGVFDFGNCGIYERWRDLAVIYTSKNFHLYKLVEKFYEQYTGIKVDRQRVINLAEMEWLWAKRWYKGNIFTPLTNKHYIAKCLSRTFGYFYKLPYCLHRTLLFTIIYIRATLNERRNKNYDK